MRKLVVLWLLLAGCLSESQRSKPEPSPVATAPAPTTTPLARPTDAGRGDGSAVGDTGNPDPDDRAADTVSSDSDETGDPGGNAVGWGWRRTSVAGPGQIRHGSGTCDCDQSYGSPVRGANGPTASFGIPESSPGMDRALIRRYVKRSVQQILACYQNQLRVAPGIAGDVTVRFRILPTGKVESATGSGFAEVDACVASVIQTIAFPHPGGTSVDVSYPITFRLRGA